MSVGHRGRLHCSPRDTRNPPSVNSRGTRGTDALGGGQQGECLALFHCLVAAGAGPGHLSIPGMAGNPEIARDPAVCGLSPPASRLPRDSTVQEEVNAAIMMVTVPNEMRRPGA